MGKPKKQHKKFDYNKNRKKAWIKSKKLPAIECKQIKHAWDKKCSIRENMKQMGLAIDANKTLRVPRTKDTLVTSIPGTTPKEKKETPRKTPTKQYVANELEAEATRPQERRLRLSEPETRYCIYMMEKYGEDYKAMARDMKNYYQDTPKQIKSKINAFKSIPEQYGEYLKSHQADLSPCLEADATTPTRQTVNMGVVPRHDTRARRAKRRNGNFTTPPGLVPTPVRRNSVKTDDLPFHRVKRKLHFGRVPPRPRPESVAQSARKMRDRKAKQGASTRKSCPVSQRSRSSRELRRLLNATFANVVPVRLRSAFKNWGHRHGDVPVETGYKLHASQEHTCLRMSDKSRRNSSDLHSPGRSLKTLRRSSQNGHRLHSSHEHTCLLRHVGRSRQC